jgi:hypothetical protein
MRRPVSRIAALLFLSVVLTACAKSYWHPEPIAVGTMPEPRPAAGKK